MYTPYTILDEELIENLNENVIDRSIGVSQSPEN